MEATMSDEKPSPVMSETLIERSVSLANRAITMGYPVPMALAALETALIAAWRECDALVMLELVHRWFKDGPTCDSLHMHCHCVRCDTRALLKKHGRTP